MDYFKYIISRLSIAALYAIFT